MNWIKEINEAQIELLTVNDIKAIITSLNVAYAALLTVSQNQALDSTEFAATNHNKITLSFCNDVAREALVNGVVTLEEPKDQMLEVS